MSTLLEICGLHIRYRTSRGEAQAVSDVSLRLEAGDYLGLVGESGCGKSTIAKAIMGILPANGYVSAGKIKLEGVDLPSLPTAELRRRLWCDIALVPQSAMNGFDPVYRVGDQIDEAIRLHSRQPAEQRRHRLDELFSMVGINPQRLMDYPHQFSGGMRQRGMIAMAMALNPKVIVADEPTTGLDVLVQDQILQRIKALHTELGKTMLLITHDLAVVAENCNKIAVMYAGKIVEQGGAEVFERPTHPYTIGLRAAFPDIEDRAGSLIAIPGAPPDLTPPPQGCRFRERCPLAHDICRMQEPELRLAVTGQMVACHFADKLAGLDFSSQQALLWKEADVKEGSVERL